MGRKSQRGRHHGRPGPGRRDGNLDAHSHVVPSFSLQEEARNTERHRSMWSSGQKLRHMRINFVSAGHLVGDGPVKLLPKDPEQLPKYTLQKTAPMPGHAMSPMNLVNVPANPPEDEDIIVAQTLENLELSPSTIKMNEVLDLTAEEKHLKSVPRSTSPALSDSSVEIVVFKGRGVGTNPPNSRLDSFSASKLLSASDVQYPVADELICDASQDADKQDHLLDYAQNIRDYSGHYLNGEATSEHNQKLSTSPLSNNDWIGEVSSVFPTAIQNNHDLSMAVVAHHDHDFQTSHRDSDEVNDGSDDEAEAEAGMIDEDDEIDDEQDDEQDEDADDGQEATISDEALAHLLSQQEEDGFLDIDSIAYDRYFATAASLDDVFGISHHMSRSRKSRPKSRHVREEYPSASLMADILEQDPYNGFDVMDFERPSLRQKRGGRQPPISMNLSDSDLEARLQASWKADRMKKAEKKRERAQLRAAGTLGRNKKTDFSVKYPLGMSVADIKEEIKEFLNSTHTSFQLPPMEKSDRALVHGLALKLDMKSKSVGHGKNRAPTLIKTSRTRPFNEEIFMRFETMVSRGSLGGHAKGKQQRTTVSYRDGEVVGAAAPEIGIDNRGRAMLEKMGWTNGTALGAINNKGILTPISHIVKTTKAGLG